MTIENSTHPRISIREQELEFSQKQKRLARAKRRKDKGLPPREMKTDPFYRSWEWSEIRIKALVKYGSFCRACGHGPPNVALQVDHIKPKKDFPELALDIDNLQVLCGSCNKGKGAWLIYDFRRAKRGDIMTRIKLIEILTAAAFGDLEPETREILEGHAASIVESACNRLLDILGYGDEIPKLSKKNNAQEK